MCGTRKRKYLFDNQTVSVSLCHFGEGKNVPPKAISSVNFLRENKKSKQHSDGVQFNTATIWVDKRLTEPCASQCP